MIFCDIYINSNMLWKSLVSVGDKVTGTTNPIACEAGGGGSFSVFQFIIGRKAKFQFGFCENKRKKFVLIQVYRHSKFSQQTLG